MRGNKKLVQGVAVASAAGILVCSVTFSQPQIMQTEETIQTIGNGTEGIMAAWNQEEQLSDILPQEVTIEKNEAFIVAAGNDTSVKSLSDNKQLAEKKENNSVSAKAREDKQSEADKQTQTEEKKVKTDKLTQTEEKSEEQADVKSEEKTELKEKTKKKAETQKREKQSVKEKKWAKKLMADVDDYLNIRESSNEESKIVGKLRRGDVAKVLQKGKEWTKIKSGSVTGFVKNEYCVYGTKAYRLAKKICKIYATVQADGLRIRRKANEDAVILEAAFKGDKLLVDTDARKKDGWVVVKLNDLKGYVAKEFVEVGLGTGKAISIEEEQAQLAAKKKAEQAAAASARSTTAASSSAVSSGDLTLLSAIIFCEAGGESYAGQVAVGAVVMNRVRSSSYPNSISGVVYQSGQFSPVSNGSLARALSNGNYQNCTSAARAALAGSDNTGGAKFFHRANGAAGLVIGNHVFY